MGIFYFLALFPSRNGQYFVSLFSFQYSFATPYYTDEAHWCQAFIESCNAFPMRANSKFSLRNDSSKLENAIRENSSLHFLVFCYASKKHDVTRENILESEQLWQLEKRFWHCCNKKPPFYPEKKLPKNWTYHGPPSGKRLKNREKRLPLWTFSQRLVAIYQQIVTKQRVVQEALPMVEANDTDCRTKLRSRWKVRSEKLRFIWTFDSGALFLAETQVGGHGRFNRPFFSPKGKGLNELIAEAKPYLPASCLQYTLLAAGSCGAMQSMSWPAKKHKSSGSTIFT